MAPRGELAAPAARTLVAMPRFTCETTCIGFFMVLVELGVTAGFFLLYGLTQVHQSLYVACGIISLLSVGSGVLGLCRSTPAVIASIIVAIAVAFAFVLLGGLCVIYTFDVRSAVASYLNKSLSRISQSANQKLLRDTKIGLALAAALLLFSALCHFVFSRHLQKLVGPRRACIAFLQTFSLVVVPFSLFLVVGGQYIADSGTLATAPYTAIVIFGCGVLLLSIALLAFIGGSFEYRRLLSLCVLLAYATATLLVGLSIAYFALKTRINAYVLLNWELLRVVLPPTVRARYDRDQFVALVQTNLQIVAYVAIVSGLFAFQTAGNCVGLMNHAAAVKRQLAHDKQSMRRLEADANESESDAAANDNVPSKPYAVDPQVLQRDAWRQYFEPSKRRQRIAMRVVAFLLAVAVALILAVMCANVVFATKCNSIGKLVQDANYTLFASANESADVATVNVTNRFARGTVSIQAAASELGFVRLVQYGNAERSMEESYVQALHGSSVNVEARPIAVTRFLWLDGSCQRSVLSVEIPTDQLRELVVTSNASVDIHGGADGPSLPFRRLSVATDQANVNVSQLLVDDGGLAVTSASGEVEMSDVTVDGTSGVGVDTKALVYAALGSLTVDNVTFLDCDATLQVGAGTMELTRIDATATSGRSHIRVASTSGSIFADSLRANWLELSSRDGDISAAALRTTGNSAFMGRLEVTSVAGDVSLQQVAPSGSVHIETSSGDIMLQLQTLAFTGLYYAHSDFGNVTVRVGAFGSDSVTPLPTATAADLQGGVNCNPTNTSCLSYGDLYLHSRLGDIHVILGCDTYQCD